MTYLTLGQLNIPVAWLAFFIAIFYSDFRSRKADVATNKLVEHLLFVYIFVWKISYLLFSWTDFVKAPLSLIYFDGGLKGHVLAILIIAVVLFKKRNTVQWSVTLHYWVRLLSVYHMISYGFQEQWIIVGIWLLLLLLAERHYSHWILLGQYLLLAWLDGFLGSFTLAQIVVLIIVYLNTKQAQYIAVAGILSLVAVMLGDVDVDKTTDKTARGMIDLPTTTGETYRLTEQKQELTVVNFFATWCPPCKAEMPHLQSFAEDLPTGVEIIGVNLTDRDDGKQALADFMDTYEVTYPILLDETDEVGTAFKVMSIPTTVLLNVKGEELERIVGPVSKDGLRQLIKKHQ